ncbi:hypothetical protein ACQW02_24090 [Humitalea sp. 24SJ18S-53]|uniref:hypothetical protein n=1 Tax=Humitalea sp. 24SJ18S-53 TaxID=3422307 RepID=UPI003D67735F
MEVMQGWSSLAIKLDFDMYDPCPDYSFATRKQKVPKGDWPIIVPQTAPDVVQGVDDLMAKMIKVTWAIAEPKADAQRGSASPGQRHNAPPTIGTRGGPQPQANGVGYKPQVRPTPSVMDVKQGDKSAIATDWWLTPELKRSNAVTFRGDKRAPADLFEAGGFSPPDTRTDRDYLQRTVANAFADYMFRRYGRRFTPEEIADWGVKYGKEVISKEQNELLYQYTMWRKIVKKESAHIGRMTDNELLKGFTSTSRAIDSSITFATFKNTTGWIYVSVVHSGYVIPYCEDSSVAWGTPEAEIAQFGAVPWDRIVGFMRISADTMRPNSPIFLRRSFRVQEPNACDRIYEIMSGRTPDQKPK